MHDKIKICNMINVSFQQSSPDMLNGCMIDNDMKMCIMMNVPFQQSLSNMPKGCPRFDSKSLAQIAIDDDLIAFL